MPESTKSPAEKGADGDLTPERVLSRICDAQKRHYGNATALHLALIGLCIDGRAALALRAQPPAREDAQPVWVDGVPTKHHAKEWFIAETTFGDRVVLTALPEEYYYDFKTADETYVKAERIKRWMPFPDSQYLFPQPAPDALREAVEALGFYAAKTTYVGNPTPHHRPILIDAGETARQALAALQAEQGAK